MIKKFQAFFLCAAITLSLTACGENEGSVNSADDDISNKSSSHSEKLEGSDSDPKENSGESEKNSGESENNSSENLSEPAADPVPVTIDWDNIPEAPETDFKYEDTYLENGVEIVKYLGKGGDINIPKTLGGKRVTKIGWGAFEDCASLTNVKIPEGAVLIYKWAFAGCTSLVSVSVPESMTGIDTLSFKDCTSLTSINFPDRVTYIGGGIFSGCTSITSVKLPDYVIEIYTTAFNDCPNISVTYRGKVYTQSNMKDLYKAIGENEFAVVH